MSHLSNFTRLLLLCALSTLIGLSLAACNQQEIDLVFTTIEQRDISGTGKVYEGKQPGLTIVAKSDEASNLDGLITAEAQTKLQSLGYSKYFAVAAFQGWQSTTQYGVQIERVTRSGNTVTIYAKFRVPRPEDEKGAAETSPYHLISVQKSGTWGEKITFKLIVADATVASISHDIP
jgi:hypothetical protein